MGKRTLEINTPANLPQKAALSPAGGSNIKIILALLDRTRDVPEMWLSAVSSKQQPRWDCLASEEKLPG